MSTANSPEVFKIDDTDHLARFKITGYYTSANTANIVAVQANTLYGADNTKPCILSFAGLEYTSSMANGWVALEFVSTVNANSRIIGVGRFNDGIIEKYCPNSASTPSGDINLCVYQASAGDSFTLIATFIKELQGMYWTGTNYGAGAWANGQLPYSNPGY